MANSWFAMACTLGLLHCSSNPETSAPADKRERPATTHASGRAWHLAGSSSAQGANMINTSSLSGRSLQRSAIVVAVALALGACSSMNERERTTAKGAGIGAAGGAVVGGVTGGVTGGT